MSNKIYTTVPIPKFPRNVFSLSRPVVGSLRMQRLYPTEILEIVPGDAINLSQETFLRTAPLVAPPLAKVTLSHHAFFVPAWQLHEHFDDFITGGEKMDFTDHLPYTHVGDIYQWIDGLLQAQYYALYSVSAWSDTPSYICSDQCLDDIVSLIEAFDYSRAIPFSMPEFSKPQCEITGGSIVGWSDLSLDLWTDEAAAIALMRDVCKANLDSWRALNPTFLHSSDLRVNLLPFYAQLKIWCEYFRDQNLVDDYWDQVVRSTSLFSAVDYQDFGLSIYNQVSMDPTDFTSDMLDDWLSYVILFSTKKRAWKKDRFTSAQPWTQKGPDVYLPLAGSLPVEVTDAKSRPTSSQSVVISATGKIQAPGGTNRPLVGSGDLSNISGGTLLRDVRRAEAVLEFEEADGRFGNRYPENTLGQFGVYTPDSRLPRSQFLGSTRQTVGFSEIPQTSETGSTPLGTLAGKGTSYNPGFLFKHRFTMHGFVIIFTSIQVSALYEQGIHPMFSRFDRTEYAWPRYARLGEEPIYAKELSIFGENITDDAVFGYAPRYSSYKSDTGSIHGQMKSTLSYWTFSRKFPMDQDPHLNEEFIYNDPRRDAFAVTNSYAENFYFEIDWKVRSSRLLPFFGVPSI